MKISVITPSFNSGSTIRDTIDSVLAQNYANIEYIIVDGASSDETVDIVNGYGNRIAKFISEKDGGIYNAMNKGISMSTGDIVGILNSDDFYADVSVLSDVDIVNGYGNRIAKFISEKDGTGELFITGYLLSELCKTW